MQKKEFIPTSYTSDLTDKEWGMTEAFFTTGNKSVWPRRSLVNAVLYLKKTGCQWRLLPHDFSPHDTVWSFYRRARKSGLWGRIMDALVRKTREHAGVMLHQAMESLILKARKPSPRVRSAAMTREKTKGRKRHIVVDIMGNLLAVVVHAANIHDTKSGIKPAKRAFEKYPAIKKFCGDDGYHKSFEEDVSSQLGLSVDISKRIKPVFEVIPKRWVVERTFSWLNHSRRLSKDYEINVNSEETMVIISHLHTLLRRLARL